VATSGNVNYPADEYWSFIPVYGPDAGTEISLQMQHWNIGVWGGSRFSLPTLRGQDIEQPYRAGMQNRPKFPNSRTITLGMWTAGINQVTGQPDTADQILAFNNNVQQLRQMFYQRGPSGSVQSQLRRRWRVTQQGLAQVVTATAMCEIAGTMEPTNMGRTSAAFSVDLLLADPYFYGAARELAIGTAGGSIFGAGEGVVGEGYPSPVSAFTLSLSAGPVTVTNQTAGVSVTYGATIANSPVLLDILNSTAADDAGNNVIANVSHSGARPWMVLVPGSNVISVSAGTATFNFSDCYV
jgi:hypothetical protein